MPGVLTLGILKDCGRPRPRPRPRPKPITGMEEVRVETESAVEVATEEEVDWCFWRGTITVPVGSSGFSGKWLRVRVISNFGQSNSEKTKLQNKKVSLYI